MESTEKKHWAGLIIGLLITALIIIFTGSGLWLNHLRREAEFALGHDERQTGADEGRLSQPPAAGAGWSYVNDLYGYDIKVPALFLGLRPSASVDISNKSDIAFYRGRDLILSIRTGSDEYYQPSVGEEGRGAEEDSIPEGAEIIESGQTEAAAAFVRYRLAGGEEVVRLDYDKRRLEFILAPKDQAEREIVERIIASVRFRPAN